MTAYQIAFVSAGAFAGGFVSGLAGFGTGITAMGIWLHALGPAVASPLAVICSVVSQAQTIPAIWHAVRPRRVLPFIIPGLCGVPVGVYLLGVVDPNAFRFGIGLFLIAFSLFSLIIGRGLHFAGGGRPADSVIGLCGGVLGGLAGLSGVLPTMWASIRGWGKDDRRALFQAYNLSILFVAMTSHAISGKWTAQVGWALLAALPGTLGGSWLGARVYRRLADRHFHAIILGLLTFSGVALVWGSL